MLKPNDTEIHLGKDSFPVFPSPLFLTPGKLIPRVLVFTWNNSYLGQAVTCHEEGGGGKIFSVLSVELNC